MIELLPFCTISPRSGTDYTERLILYVLEGHTTQLVQTAVTFRGQSPQSKGSAPYFHKFHPFFLIYTNNNGVHISVSEFTCFDSVGCDFIFIGIRNLPLPNPSGSDQKSLNHHLACLPGKYRHGFLAFRTLRLF
jgi:hypothetical protein